MSPHYITQLFEDITGQRVRSIDQDLGSQAMRVYFASGHRVPVTYYEIEQMKWGRIDPLNFLAMYGVPTRKLSVGPICASDELLFDHRNSYTSAGTTTTISRSSIENAISVLQNPYKASTVPEPPTMKYCIVCSKKLSDKLSYDQQQTEMKKDRLGRCAHQVEEFWKKFKRVDQATKHRERKV